MVIFNSYVNLPEGSFLPRKPSQFDSEPPRQVLHISQLLLHTAAISTSSGIAPGHNPGGSMESQ